MDVYRDIEILIFCESPDWHVHSLKTAFEARGILVSLARLHDCGFDSTLPFGLAIPGFEKKLPQGAFVRGIAAGTFEQITMRLGVLHALRTSGVSVWNDARAIEICIDKSMTSHVLANTGLAVPQTFAVQSHALAREIVLRETSPGNELVLKPLFGAQGQGLRRIAKADDLPEDEIVSGAYYLQRYIEGTCTPQDIRVLVSNGRALAAMTRSAPTGGWITNVRQGGKPAALAMTDEIITLAVAAAEVTGANYAGVDLIRSRDGNLLVLEVNSTPAWRGLQSVTPDLDIGQTIASDFLDTLQ